MHKPLLRQGHSLPTQGPTQGLPTQGHSLSAQGLQKGTIVIYLEFMQSSKQSSGKMEIWDHVEIGTKL